MLQKLDKKIYESGGNNDIRFLILLQTTGVYLLNKYTKVTSKLAGKKEPVVPYEKAPMVKQLANLRAVGGVI